MQPFDSLKALAAALLLASAPTAHGAIVNEGAAQIESAVAKLQSPDVENKPENLNLVAPSNTDGTIVLGHKSHSSHASHASHASHSSHRSHYSSSF